MDLWELSLEYPRWLPFVDAVYGSADTLCGNFVGWIMGALGERNRATDYLRRINLEYASVPSGGWP